MFPFIKQGGALTPIKNHTRRPSLKEDAGHSQLQHP